MSAKKKILRPPFPWGYAVELRKTTDADAARFSVPVYSPWIAQGGTATLYVSEIDVKDDVQTCDLPQYLRALADRYNRVHQYSSAEDAVVLVARRFARTS